MFFGALVDSLGLRLQNFDASKVPDRTTAKYYLNQSAKWIYESWNWEQRKKISEFTQIPNYATGTCTVTKFDGTNESASRTVTFDTVLPSGLAGRFFQPFNESAWHRILFTSGSTAYLQSPVLTASGSGMAFKIWKKIYYLPSAVDSVLKIGKFDGIGELTYHDEQALQDMVIDFTQDGTPSDYSPLGDDDFWQPYIAGTIVIFQDTNLVAGTGTNWVGNVYTGDILQISNVNYHIKRVETDTQIILHNYLSQAVAQGTQYKILKDVTTGIQLLPNENNFRTIPYVYLDKQYDMVHEKLERPKLPDRFDEAILTRAEMMILKDKDNSKWQLVSQLLENQLDLLKKRKSVVQTRYNRFAPVTSNMPGRTNG